MIQDLLEDIRIYNRCGDANRPAAVLTLIYFDGEDLLSRCAQVIAQVFGLR